MPLETFIKFCNANLAALNFVLERIFAKQQHSQFVRSEYQSSRTFLDQIQP
jgi:hypothetical protein